MVRELQSPTGPPTKILRDLASSKWQLQQHGATDLPTWAEVASGVEPPAASNDIDAADFDRGWQCHVCSFSEDFYKNNVVLPSCDDARRAMLLSQSGGPASAWLRAIPSQPVFTFTPLRFQMAIRRRLRWPLPVSTGKCSKSCNHTLDNKGDHAASCATSGRKKPRSVPMERIRERILREASKRVRENVMLRDTAVPTINPADGRKIEIVATGLPVYRGVPLAIDVTFISPLHADGSPWPHAVERPGVSFKRALRQKHRTYSELVPNSVYVQ